MKSSRELFEEMYAKHTDASNGYTGDLFARNGDHYVYPHVQAAWFGWEQRDKLAVETEQALLEAERGNTAFAAALDYFLNCEEGEFDFITYWNEGDFDIIREGWPDAPVAIYYADPLADHAAIDAQLAQEAGQ